MNLKPIAISDRLHSVLVEVQFKLLKKTKKRKSFGEILEAGFDERRVLNAK